MGSIPIYSRQKPRARLFCKCARSIQFRVPDARGRDALEEGMNQDLLRRLPKMDVMLNSPRMKELSARHPYAIVRETLREYLDELRSAVSSGRVSELPDREAVCREVGRRLEGGGYSLRRVINGSGVILHTNLGRAPIGEEAARHLAETASGYCSLEYDLEAGARGNRAARVEQLICSLTGAEDALVVNNNAGAVFLMLNTLARGRKTAVSRGEQVEIGGSFRIPEIMRESGAELIEIGTTNKTHLSDYERAVSVEGASVIMKVHRSNFHIEGFTESVELPALAELAGRTGALLLYDCGAAFLRAPESPALREGVDAARCIRDGADVICFSGDKLLGSAQSGILAGKKKYIGEMRKNQLARMLRIDKLSLAALETSLRFCCDPQLAAEKIPVLRMLSMTPGRCREEAERLRRMILEKAPEAAADVCAVSDGMGGGALPGAVLQGAGVAVEMPGLSGNELEKKLRENVVPIVSLVRDGRVLISVRTLFGRDFDDIAAAFALLGGGNEKSRETT